MCHGEEQGRRLEPVALLSSWGSGLAAEAGLVFYGASSVPGLGLGSLHRERDVLLESEGQGHPERKGWQDS